VQHINHYRIQKLKHLMVIHNKAKDVDILIKDMGRGIP